MGHATKFYHNFDAVCIAKASDPKFVPIIE